MQFDVIGSGSSGNCTFIKSGDDCIIIDLGISKRRVEKAISTYGVSLDNIKAYFISHSHSDHASHYQMANPDLIYSADCDVLQETISLPKKQIMTFYEPIKCGVFQVIAIPLSHDAKNTAGFIVDDGKQSLVYITDTGFIAERDFSLLSNRDYYILESNHDLNMLLHSDRPYELIHRVSSDRGHINNEDCGYYLSCFITENTKQIILAHLSDDCNTEQLALDTVKDVMTQQLGFLPDIDIRCAKRKEEVKGGMLC